MIELLMAMQINTAVIKPPERFRGEAVILTYYAEPARVAKLCGGWDKRGCNIKRDGFEMNVVLNPCAYADTEKFARDMCHEKAHALGWGGDHGK